MVQTQANNRETRMIRRMQPDDMERLLGNLFSRPLPTEEFEAFAATVLPELNS